MASPTFRGTTEVPAGAIEAAEAFVRRELEGYDASHDWSHIDRVRRMAMRLAAEEGLVDDVSLAVVELAAILHDVCDWKYNKSKDAAADAIMGFLQEQCVGQLATTRILAIVGSVGFKEELPAKSEGSALAAQTIPASVAAEKPSSTKLPLEAQVVQDADRLDAVGAVGIARCFTFGGRFQRVLHDPAVPPRTQLTKDQYMQGGERSTTLNHFEEKLFKLKGLMKTAAGRRIAESRHEYMVEFVKRFMDEYEGIR